MPFSFDSLHLDDDEAMSARRAQWEKLCAVVELVDNDAADWVRSNIGPDRNAYSLDTLFIWDQTPQRHQYWSDIDKTLRKRYPDKYPVPSECEER